MSLKPKMRHKEGGALWWKGLLEVMSFEVLVESVRSEELQAESSKF